MQKHRAPPRPLSELQEKYRRKWCHINGLSSRNSTTNIQIFVRRKHLPNRWGFRLDRRKTSKMFYLTTGIISHTANQFGRTFRDEYPNALTYGTPGRACAASSVIMMPNYLEKPLGGACGYENIRFIDLHEVLCPVLLTSQLNHDDIDVLIMKIMCKKKNKTVSPRSKAHTFTPFAFRRSFQICANVCRTAAATISEFTRATRTA